MNTFKKLCFTIALFSLALTGAVQAQQRDFPDERTRTASCDDFEWNNDMVREHPRVVDACQEVVEAGDSNWARLSANYVEVLGDDSVVFDIQDKNGRFVERVTIQPRPGQVAYIDNRATPFESLRNSDQINLYAPEGRYGFGMQPGVPLDELAAVTPSAAVTPAPAPAVQQVAQREQPDILPQTASPAPFLALVGLLSLFGGLALTLQRRN